MHVAIIHTDNNMEVGDYPVNLTWMQQQVGGYIEAISLLDDGTVMYCNEEGKIHNLPVNVIATELYRAAHGPYDIIMGDVILLGTDDCENADLTQRGFEFLTKAVETARATWS
jgi:hypothetical protein